MVDEMTPIEAVEHAIRSRRAVRAFLPDPVEPELLRRLIELAAQAPSGTNMQPWKHDVELAETLEAPRNT